MKTKLNDFFKLSDFLNYLVLRPLSHIRGNWELTYDIDNDSYEEEEDSFARELNSLINELGNTEIPRRYHDNEDKLAQYVKETFNKEIKKVGNMWVGADYRIILQDGGFDDINEENLVQSAVGRIIAAKKCKQHHFDDMEESHRKMLSVIITLILYHRAVRNA